ncbi:MAG: M1 family aminopeptidase [Phycisphaerae bacterium]
MQGKPAVLIVPATLMLLLNPASQAVATSPGDCPAPGKHWACGHAMQPAGLPAPRGVFGPGDPQPETLWTDVTHTKIDIDVDPTARTISGIVTIDATSLINGLTSLVLYLNPTGGAMIVTGVGGNGVSYTYIGDTVTVTLDATYNTGQIFTVSVAYRGSPQDGVYWGSHNNGTSVVDIVATLSEPYSARGWWVGKDVLNDKCTFEIWVTVPDTLVVVSNGLLQGVDPMPGAKLRYRWSESNPMIPYLASLAIGDYQLYATQYVHLGDTMPMDFYILPESNTPAWQAHADTYVTMTQVFSDVYGQYPFITEKGGMVHTPTLGGTFMEHQTIPSMPVFDIDWINAHELSHQWWGDTVTCETWGDTWLNEGFATFSEAIWAEFKPGGSLSAYHAWMDARLPWNPDARVFVTNVNSVGAIFATNSSYYKGSWVLHMLRHVLGDATFFQALLDYRAAFEGDSATTGEFAASVSATAGYDLSFFTNQWVMNTGSPDYEYAWAPGQAGGQDYLLLRIDQTQGNRGFGLVKMPIDVAVTTTAGTATYVVWSINAIDTFAIPIPGPPQQVSLDPDAWVLTHSMAQAGLVIGAPVCQGDMNEDGAVRGDDIQLFVSALVNPAAAPEVWRRADMNLDGHHDAGDVPAFVNALIGTACPP